MAHRVTNNPVTQLTAPEEDAHLFGSQKKMLKGVYVSYLNSHFLYEEYNRVVWYVECWFPMLLFVCPRHYLRCYSIDDPFHSLFRQNDEHTQHKHPYMHKALWLGVQRVKKKKSQYAFCIQSKQI